MTRISKRLLLLSAILLLLVIAILHYGQTTIDFHDLSVQQLTNGGYYAYILPEDYTKSLGWKRNIWMTSFDWQCQFDIHDRWNPVEVRYTDASGNWLFDIYISPQDGLWNNAEALTTVQVKADWIPTNEGAFYPLQKGIRIKVKDKQGMDIVFSSYMEVSKLIDLIEQMTYAGPNLVASSNPWLNACERRQ